MVGLIMKKFATTALLLMALLLPVVLFWLVRSRSHLNGLAAAAIAVAIGWALNVAGAFASQGGNTNDPSQVNGDTLSIAMRFGWACPTVLVLITWLVWHFKTRHGARALPCAAANPAIASRLQSNAHVGRIADVGALSQVAVFSLQRDTPCLSRRVPMW